MSFLVKTGLLNKCQHGFMKGKSTTTAVCEFINNILRDLDDQRRTMGIFYDYSKAFDTVNHGILLQILHTLGIAGAANDWVRDFLKDRKQIVSLRGSNGVVMSEEKTVNIGVPQGSTISPLLFTVFTNFLPNAITTGKLTFYADDASHAISASHNGDANDRRSCADQLTEIANKAVGEMVNFCKNHELYLNSKKTVVMRFAARLNKSRALSSPLIRLEGRSIQEVTEIKFLGITLDNTLDWGSHVNIISKQVASACFLIRKLVQLVDVCTVKLVYFGYIQSRLQYGIVLWGASSHANRLFVLQKKAIRCMAGASTNPCDTVFYKDSCRPLFKEFNILPLPCLFIYRSILFIIDSSGTTISRNRDTHKYGTRNKTDFRTELHKLSIYARGPQYTSCKLYNALPSRLKEVAGKPAMFKGMLRSFLIEHCFYSVAEFYSYKNW
jgi:Reverse transcriptase (RNA-dependent DNA polymerase)